MTFVPYPATTDPDAIVTAALAQLRAATGAQLNEAHPIVALLEVLAYLNAETRIVIADVSKALYREHGRQAYGITPVDAAAATVESTWTATDSAGYTIPAGTVVAYPTAGDRAVGFAVVDETTISPGSTQATGVTLEALVPGEAANGLAAGTLTLVDQLTWVSSVVTTGATAGGQDAETDDEYADRLFAAIRAQSTGGLVLAADFENAARGVAGVHRAIAIDGYEPAGPSTGNALTVTIAVVDEDGAAVSAAVKDAVEAEIESRRMVNFTAHVVDPDFTAVAVVFTAVAQDGYDLVQTEAAAEAAVLAHLDPGRWAGGDEPVPAWRSEPVRYLEVAAVINNVEGVDYVSTLTLNGGTSDVTLGGVAPLPDPTVDGTVS